MIFGDKTRLEEYIIELLDEGSLDGPNLLSSLENRYNKKTTKQAVYKSLRKLRDEEVINKTGNNYSLNRVWLQKIREFTDRHTIKTDRVDTMNVLDFEDGDSVTYRFKNPFTLDITWGHLYDIIFEADERHHVMLNHHPHEWLMISRTETEKFWLGQINKKKKMMLFTLSKKTPLDKKFQKDNASEYIKINLDESYGLKPNQYLSVIGDYIFEITTDPEFEKRVDQFFNENDYIDDLAQKQINAISKQKYKSKLKLSKNKKKAEAWRRKYKQDFYIPKPYYLFEENS
jgi:DNA-binding PadR family transcriptional regulator